MRGHQMFSLREELRTGKSCSLAPFHGWQSGRNPLIAANFDFQAYVGPEIEVKVKLAELVGRCIRDAALGAMKCDGNQIQLTLGPVAIRNLAYEGNVRGIGLRFEPQVRHQTSGPIDQLP